MKPIIKSFHFLIAILTTLTMISCASIKTGTTKTGELFYETDFSDYEDVFIYGEGEIQEIENGVLHLKDTWVGLDKHFGRNSTTEFRIKFGDPPFAHINFLQNEDKRILIHINEDGIHFITFSGHDEQEEFIEMQLFPGEWYDFMVTISNRQLTLSIDGIKKGSIKVDRRLPPEGIVSFECHEEYWVDSLRIFIHDETDEVLVKESEISTFNIKYGEVREVMAMWEEAIRTRNHDLLSSILWPETTLLFTNRKGKRLGIHGIDAIREFRLEFFEELGPLEIYRLTRPESYEDHGVTHQSYHFLFRDEHIREWLHLEKRDSKWKISYIELELPTPGTWVTNRYQAAGDLNGDGFIEGGEHHQLFIQTIEFLKSPHKATNSVDMLFDLNENGFVEEDEIFSAGEFLYNKGFLWFKEYARWATIALDINHDDEVSDDEVEQISMMMHTPWDKEETYRAVNDLDFWMDRNNDGQISVEEKNEARSHFIGTAIGSPYPDTLTQSVPRKVSNYLDELADGNSDGMIDREEQNTIFQSLTGSHEVNNFLDRSLDLDFNGHIDQNDIFQVLQASAIGSGLLADKAEPPYPVRTPMDSYLDPSGDHIVDEWEINSAADFLAGDTGAADQVSELLYNLSDWNDDGKIEQWELEEAGALVLYPHQVNRNEPFDTDSDKNEDGFIDPEELGISAGITEKGEAPSLDERIRLIRHQSGSREMETLSDSGGETTGFQSEYYRRLGKIQDQKLAVINLASETTLVDEETAKGIIVFVENAFVNVGKVRVVDRKSIEEIMSEYKFQSSALVDENTAIEIGKISGADIIVMGSINRVGGIFYLNIKLIDVKTAEIIGSNIAQASDASGFLDMCNQVVYMLF